MNTPQLPKPAGWFSGRTRLITIVSIAAVGLAGAAAVSGANVGILDAASDSDVGSVSVAGDLTPIAPQVVDVYLPADATTSTTSLARADSTSTTLAMSTMLADVAVPVTAAPAAPVAGIQEFAVDAAGIVAVAATETGLRLERVTPTAGWTWSLLQTNPTDLMVVLTNGVRTLEFAAVMTPDGTVAASVSEPVISQAPPVTSGSFDNDDHDDDDDFDDDDFDDDDHDDVDDDDVDDDHLDDDHDGGDDDD